MKAIKCYICENCEEIYNTAEEADSCETTHTDIDKLKIGDCDYRSISYRHGPHTSSYGYPATMLVEIEGRCGSLGEYQLVNEGSMEDFEPYLTPTFADW